MTHSVKCDRDLLVSRLSKAITFVPRKPIIPVWNNFLFSIDAGVLSITACDGNVNVRVSCLVESKTEWSVCVPAGLIYKLVSLLKENVVTITLKSEKKVEIKSGKSKSTITLDAFPKEFGLMAVGSVTSEVTMHQLTLRAAIKNVKSFVDDDSAVDAYQTMNISEVSGRIVFTGINTPMICRAAISPISINHWDSINIHADTAKKVIGLLGEKGEVSVVHSGDKIKFFTAPDHPEHFEVTAVVANKPFADTEAFFSKKPAAKILVNTMEFLDAVRRLSLYKIDDDEPTVNIVTRNSENINLITRDVLTDREGEEDMSIVNPENLTLSIAFGNKYLAQVFASIEHAETYMYFTPGSPRQSMYFVPKVSTAVEDIYTFAIAPCNPV